MAKFREAPCKYYMNEGNCEKGRDGTYRSYCQKCSKYEPRKVGISRHLNSGKYFKISVDNTLDGWYSIRGLRKELRCPRNRPKVLQANICSKKGLTYMT